MAQVAYLDPGSHYLEQFLARPALGGRVRALDIYDLPDADLEDAPALFVPGMADQELLLRHRDVVRDFLDRGRVVVFCGHLFREWLPGASPFVPAPIESFRDYAVRIPTPPHPIFEGVSEQDLTFRRGVAGFFARGHHPPPDGAEVLLRLAGGQPITYLDRRSTGGTVLVHSGAELLGYGSDRDTAGRIGPQLLDWIDAEVEALRERAEAAR